MATKRDYYNIDPDYEDVSEQQNKRQRLIEKDAKEETIRKIENIIRKEISHEIHTREAELNLIDQSIYQARHLLDRLRACLVANYYSNTPQGTLSQDNSPSTSAPFIHPTVKKYLGKHPLTSKESEDKQDSDNKDTWQDNSSSSTDKPSLSNGSTGSSQAARSTTTTSSNEIPRASNSGIKSVAQSNSNGSRTSRFRIKKKIIVGNASKFIPLDRREENDPSTHKWLIYVRGPKEEPQIDHFVKKVWFFLHPSYRPNDLVEIVHPPFHLSRRGWGEFPVRVQLHFYDQRNKRVDIIHQLKLDRTYTGLQTLGAETTVEIEIEKENVFDRNTSVVCAGNLPCLSVSPLPCPINHQSSAAAASKNVLAEEHKTIVETTVHHSPMKKEPPSTEVQPSLPLPTPSHGGETESTQGKEVASTSSSSPAKNIKIKESPGVSVAENTTPAVVSSLAGGNQTRPSSSSYTETTVVTTPTPPTTTTVIAPPKSTALLPSPIIITTPQKSLAPSSGVKIGPSLASSSVPQAPYFVALSSIANPKLSIPVVMTNAAVRPKNPVIATTSTAPAVSSKQGNLQFSTTIPTTKVQTLQGVPLNNLLKTLNSNSKVLWMSPPILPQVRASKPTGVIPTSSSASTSHLTSSAQSISSILLPSPTPTPSSSSFSSSSLIPTQEKTTSMLFSNTIALTTTVSTASSSKCSPAESSTGTKLILAGDPAVKSLPGSSFETRPVISSLDNNYITIQFNTNPTDNINQSALPQKKVTVAGDKIAPTKEGGPVISPFRVTPQGLVSIPSRISPSSTSVQATAAQLCKTNSTSSVPVVHMSTGQQPTSSALSSTFKTLGKLPTGTGTAPIILLSGTSVARTSAVITTTTTPIKKVATQQPQGLLVPSSSFSQSVVRPISTEVKNIPNKTSLLFLSPTTNSSNLVKGAATSGGKVVYASQPTTHNTVNASASAVHTHVLASAASSSLAGTPPTTKVCFIQNPPQVTDVQKTTVGTTQPLKCSVIGSNPSALTSSKQTYVLTTTKNKGLSLLPSHLVLKPGSESRPDAMQSVLYKAAPPTDNTPSTQIVSSTTQSAPTGLTLAPTRPMLLLKNQKAPMIVTNPIGINNPVTSATPTQMQVLSSNKPTQQTSVVSTGKDTDNSTMSLQLQYANGHLVLAPPTVRSALGNNVAGGQKIFLKVLPSTTASSTIPATNGPKIVNGNSPLNVVSLATTTIPASSVSNTCSSVSTSAKTAQEQNPAQSSRPVKTIENEKRIHGYNKVKKSESAQPATVPLINFSCLPDMISLIRSAVRLHPLVAANIDRSLHPYAAFTTEQWLSWNIGKRRASEWQRALSVRLYIIRLLNGATSFQGEKVWTTKQIFCWCRMHAYSPHHLEASSTSLNPKDELLSSSTNNLLPLQPLTSFSSMVALEKRLEAQESQIPTPHIEDEIEIDVVSTDFPKVRIKRETESNSCQWQSPHKQIFLPVSDSAHYVQDVARQVGVHFKPTEMDNQIHGSVCEMMLFSSLENLVSDVLRTAFALKSKKGRYPTELSLADIHAALNKIPGADFLTNANLGLVSHPDTHSNDHHKQKHGIT